MNATRLVCLAAIPLAIALSGCESMPRVLGSMNPWDKSAQKQPAQEAPAEAAEAPQTETTEEAAPLPAPAPVAASRGLPELQAGVSKYEDGEYRDAAARLQRALAAGLTRAEQVRAHKYLAFIHCASKRERQCRSEFRKALALDPGLQLNAAESGHPIWGPVFREVKQRG